MYGVLDKIETTAGESIEGFAVLIESSPDGEKRAVLRLPTAAEMMEYLGAQKQVYVDLGRGRGKYQPTSSPEAELKLLRAIRIDKGKEFDEAEAEYAVDLITKCAATSCERAGQNYIITVKTVFGPTTHTLRIPYRKEMAEYTRTFFDQRQLPHGIEERRFPPSVSCNLYDKVKVATDGYAALTEVPPHHKRSAIYELVSTINSQDPSFDPNS